MNEDELRNALRQKGGPAPASREILHRAQLAAANRRRRRDNAYAALAGGAMSAIALTAVFVPQIGDSSKPIAPTPETKQQEIALADSRFEATESLPATKATSERPKLLVGASTAGRLVTIDPVSGKTVKVLTVLKSPLDESKGGLIGGVSLTPDSKTVYFDAATKNEGVAEIRSIPVAGGESKVIAEGIGPAVSNDGKSLAYVRFSGAYDSTLIVRTLGTGAEKTVPVTGLSGAVSAPSWSKDGTKLLVQTGDSGMAIVTLDGKVVSKLQPGSDTKTGTVWDAATLLPDGNVFLSERCCTPAEDNDSRLIIVNPSGKLQSVVAYGLPKRHGHTATDTTGKHLMYLSGEDLMVSDDGGRPSPLAHGLLGAAWR